MALRSTSILALVSLAAVGCSAEERAPVGAVRDAYPEMASKVLDEGLPLVATAEGYVRADKSVAPVVETNGSWKSPPNVDVVLPKNGEEAVVLRSGAMEARVRELEAHGRAAMDSNALSYERKNGRATWSVNAGGAEEWLTVQAGVAKRDVVVASWEVEGARVREKYGVVELLDETGTPRIRATAPSAKTVSGRDVEPKLSVTGNRIQLSVDAGGEEVLVDPSWVSAGTMVHPRQWHSSATLLSGDVIVVGGDTVVGTKNVPWTDAEIYQTASNTWSLTAPMSTPRDFRPGVVTLEDGRVLVAGGGTQAGSQLTSASLYDPATDTWTPAGNMASARYFVQAVRLLDGRVLVAGADIPSNKVDIYDPSSNSWSAAAPMIRNCDLCIMTLLPDGRVFSAGESVNSGPYLNTTEIYDPNANAWSDGPLLSNTRSNEKVGVLGTGDVILAGGEDHQGNPRADVDIFHPATNTMTTAPPMAVARTEGQAGTLSSGQFLVAGGAVEDLANGASVELYDPWSNAWSPGPSLPTTLWSQATSNLVPNRGLLIAGGFMESPGFDGVTSDAELYSDLGSPCSLNDDCTISGYCADGVCCDAPCDTGPCEVCSVALGATADGTCTPLSGASCDDGDACTQTDTCQAGSCVGSNKITCAVQDECHDLGTCDPSVGTCSNPEKTNGSSCTGGTCEAGVCVPSSTTGVGGGVASSASSATVSSASSGGASAGGSNSVSVSSTSSAGGSDASSSSSSVATSSGTTSASASSASTGAGGASSSSGGSGDHGGCNISRRTEPAEESLAWAFAPLLFALRLRRRRSAAPRQAD